MRQLTTLGCLIAAIFFYVLGSEAGMALAFACGVMFEVAFYQRALKKSRIPVRIRRKM